MVDCLFYDFANDYCVKRDQTEVRVHLHSIPSSVSLQFFSTSRLLSCHHDGNRVVTRKRSTNKNPNNLMQLLLLLPLQFPTWLSTRTIRKKNPDDKLQVPGWRHLLAIYTPYFNCKNKENEVPSGKHFILGTCTCSQNLEYSTRTVLAVGLGLRIVSSGYHLQ